VSYVRSCCISFILHLCLLQVQYIAPLVVGLTPCPSPFGREETDGRRPKGRSRSRGGEIHTAGVVSPLSRAGLELRWVKEGGYNALCLALLVVGLTPCPSPSGRGETDGQRPKGRSRSRGGEIYTAGVISPLSRAGLELRWAKERGFGGEAIEGLSTPSAQVSTRGRDARATDG